MAQTTDYTRLRRMTKIYLVIQIFLVALLIFMGFYFQNALTAEGRSPRFLHSVLFALAFQLVLFYPIKKFADKEATREVASSATDLDFETTKMLRNKRIVGDVVKSGVFVFFLTFIYKAPKDAFVLSTLFLTFIFTYLSYFQCLNFLIKQAINKKS